MNPEPNGVLGAPPFLFSVEGGEDDGGGVRVDLNFHFCTIETLPLLSALLWRRLSLRRWAGPLRLLGIVGISEPVFPSPRERV